MPAPLLTSRHLNRATLARQHLLTRTRLPALDLAGHLVGLQAQDPDPPYVGLWSRIDGFRLGDLTELLERREIVRATLFRGTQHLVPARDYLWLRPLLEPMLARWQRASFGRLTAGIDPAELAAAAHDLLSRGPLNRPDLGRALAARWPGHDAVALARSVQGLLPIVHPPPDGTWRRRGPTPFALAAHYLDQPLAPDAWSLPPGATPPGDLGPPSTENGGTAIAAAGRTAAEALVLRYLAAFGPATVKDAQAWSGLTRLREVVAGLRPGPAVFRGEDGQELFDLPDAPRPDPAVPAPARFLAALDNVVLGYADRTRLMTPEQRPYTIVEAALTVDGFVRGLWSLRGGTLTIKLFAPLRPADEDAVTAEGGRLLSFAAAGEGSHDIRFVCHT